MKIKYLQQTHDSNIGDMKEVPDSQASILIKIGIAEACVENEPKFLLTPNGSPVVNDFGELVLLDHIQVLTTEKPKSAPRKPRTRK